jgi:hypothetical protein
VIPSAEKIRAAEATDNKQKKSDVA